MTEKNQSSKMSKNMFNKMTLCTVSIVQKVILTCKVVFLRLGACAKYGCLKS